MRTTKNILSHSAFWMANKRIAKHFKSNDAAIFLAYLIDKEDYYRQKNELKDIDGELYFFATSHKIEEDVNIGYKKQKKLIDLFIKEGLIDTQLYGIPAKLHFTIRHDKILLLATSSFTQTAKLDSPDGQDIYKEYIHQETEIKNTTKEGNSDELQAHPLNFFVEMTDDEISNHMKIVIDRLPEANIQAEFFHRCRNEGIKCILEYTYSGCRFDALVYDDNKNVLAIIEFKSYKTNKAPKTNTKQIDKYKKFGLPIIMVTRFEDVSWSISEVKKLINKNRPSAKKEKDAQAVELMEYYNMATNQTRSTATSGRGSKNVTWIKALLRKGYSPDEVQLMIDYKCYEWWDSPKMRIHLLNPETIFKRHGEEYIEQAIQARDNPEVMAAIKKAKEKEGGPVKVSADIYNTLKNW